MSTPQNPPVLVPRTAAGGHVPRLRDADWLPAPAVGVAPPAGAQLLHRWRGAAGAGLPVLAFLPLDGNPRHGVLGLFPAGGAPGLDAIEILERQGRWLVMPERARAQLLVRGLPVTGATVLARRSGRVSTPDHRFVFFNTVHEGDAITLVERRLEGGWPLT